MTSLLLAQKHLISIGCVALDIEGNLASEDHNPDVFLDRFIERTKHDQHIRTRCTPEYAISLRHKERAGAVRGVFTSMMRHRTRT